MPRSEKKQSLRKLALRFSGRRVLVIGDLMLDRYIRGTVSRISPEAPVPVVRVIDESFVPGGAGNVAANLAALGAQVGMVGVIGEDETGRRLLNDFLKLGIETSSIVADRGRPTSEKCRVVADRQQVVRYDRETAALLSGPTESRVLTALAAQIPKAEAVILSDYGKGVIAPKILKTAIHLAHRAGIPITVDPKIEHFRSYRGVTSITPNLAEAWAGMGRVPRPGQDQIEKLGRDILKALRSDSVLITRGPDGMSLFDHGGRVSHIPTEAKEVFDVTGAGDTVISTLTLALACGASLFEAAAISNHAAGIVVGKLGTATATVPELLRSLR